MEFPDLENEKERIVKMFSSEQGLPPDEIRFVASPYRICPLGAHIDHQGGPVLGMTINAWTLMAFGPSKDGIVELGSRNYPGKVRFDLKQIPETTGAFWGIYARAAALALAETGPLHRGITGLLDGMLPGCGLSSSASVLLAYLHALAAVNDRNLTPWEYVRTTQRAENAFIGLKNGILDQTSIVFGRRGHLLHIDTLAEKVTALPDSVGESNFRILVAYSGYSRELTTTGYNSRVQECRDAAVRLAEMAGTGAAQRLSDVPHDAFFRYGHKLAPDLAKRARHFFTESDRVREGTEAWRAGQLERFGRLMTESCRSSIEQYECGSPAIHDLQQVVASTQGVIGSRFSGGGFGGCVVGLVQPETAAAAAADIHETYKQLHPEVADQSKVYLAGSAEGVRFI